MGYENSRFFCAERCARMISSSDDAKAERSTLFRQHYVLNKKKFKYVLMVKFVKLDTVNNENYNPDQNCECAHILSIFAKILKKENMIKFIITNDANQKCLMHETYTEQ